MSATSRVDPDRFVQRIGSWSIAQALELGELASSVLNFGNTEPAVRELCMRIASDPELLTGLYAGAAVHALGAPLVRFRDLESSPGLWVIDDNATSIVFLLWSDGYKARPWKGTYYEAIVPAGRQGDLANAFEQLGATLRGQGPRKATAAAAPRTRRSRP